MFTGMWGGMWISVIFWIIVIGLVIWAIWALTRTQRGDTGDSSGESPLETLKKRYARGEITTEEFEDLKRRLEK